MYSTKIRAQRPANLKAAALEHARLGSFAIDFSWRYKLKPCLLVYIISSIPPISLPPGISRDSFAFLFFSPFFFRHLGSTLAGP
jgi:hypothetical protein